MARFQTFWIQMRKNKPLDESRKSDQTSGTKVAKVNNLEHDHTGQNCETGKHDIINR
ncbi:hypothetical protein HanOQP8_Chr14g0524731 [Helianthus annuus]|nr:hypothetical protein HanHA89_Chr14g0564151 [Helianthus annuus]KAJ0655632.1 hypothetical protein HanLR1_Chr14g0526481 [Helianthus annuus]KAJ0659320.1 hypothetical protein HanOQP8_Chr14g0524731 [Helianthus annuus]